MGKNKSCHQALQKFREEMNMKIPGQDLRRSLKVELIGLGDGLGVVIGGRVCSIEIRFSIREV